MNKCVLSLLLTTFILAPCAALSQTMSAPTIGVGPNGFDWEVGTWSCTNSMPSPMGGPSTQTLTVAKAGNGAVMFHATGTNFDQVWYNVYQPTTKSWSSPFAFADGTYGNETTTQSGAKMIWTGSATDPTGKTMQIRDTAVYAPSKTTDLGEMQTGGAWKAQYNVICTKS